jgi:shikimate kinase
VSLLTPGRNLVLVGLMGTGKSTVGRLVAERLDRPFVDTDAALEAGTHRSIAELFAELGERRFRALEGEQVRHAAALRGQVVAVGGGAVLDPGNVTQLRGTGDLVLLDGDPAELAARLTAEVADPAAVRPLLRGPADPATVLAELRARRDEAYLAAASHIVDTTGHTPEEVAEEVLRWARAVPGLLTPAELAAAS